MPRGVDPHLIAGLAWLQVGAERRRISQLQQELYTTRRELEAAQDAALPPHMSEEATRRWAAAACVHREQTLTPRAAAKKLHQEIKDKWRQPGPRIPPMPK